MAGATFIVVPFEAGEGTSLHPASPMRVRMEAYARAVAEQVAPVYAGVAVIEQPPNEFAEPRLVKAIGRVPKAMLKSLAAAKPRGWRITRHSPDIHRPSPP